MRSKSIRKKRSKQRKKTIRKKRGGNKNIQVFYGSTQITEGMDLTGQAKLYQQKPRIRIQPPNDYIITLTDPDAPAGQWTHYVAQIKSDGTVKDIYPYEPPRPPPQSGLHHYIFKVYPSLLLDNLAPVNLAPVNLSGNVYYKQRLEPIIKNKKALYSIQFTVKSSFIARAPNH